MDPRVWGPPMWRLIEDICKLADNDKRARKTVCSVLRTLELILMCSMCRNSFERMNRQVPLEDYVMHGQALRWMYITKDKVNRKLNKVTPITYEQFIRKMQATYQNCSEADLWDIYFMLAMNFPLRGESRFRAKRSAYVTFFTQMPNLWHRAFEKHQIQEEDIYDDGDDDDDYDYDDNNSSESEEEGTHYIKSGTKCRHCNKSHQSNRNTYFERNLMLLSQILSPESLEKSDFANSDTLWRWVDRRYDIYQNAHYQNTNNIFRNVGSSAVSTTYSTLRSQERGSYIQDPNRQRRKSKNALSTASKLRKRAYYLSLYGRDYVKDN